MNSTIRKLKKDYQAGVPEAGKALAKFYASELAALESIHLHPEEVYNLQAGDGVEASWVILMPTRSLHEPMEHTRLTIQFSFSEAPKGYVERGPVEASHPIAEYERVQKGKWRLVWWKEREEGKWR